MGTRALFKWSKKITHSQVERLIKTEKDVDKALLVFDSATAEYVNGFKHNHQTFGVMISKLVSANRFETAEDLLDRMRDEDCGITEEIFLSICRGYGRVHRPLQAVRVFDKMREFGCEPTQKSYISVFAILVEENHLKPAMNFYRYMKKMGIQTSVTSINVLIKALCKTSGTIDAAIKIFHEMTNRGCPPDTYTYGTLVNGLCRLGRISEAKAMFREMETEGCCPSVVTYTSLINGLCQARQTDEAMELFEEMKAKGIEPNVFTYTSLVDGFCKTGNSSRAMELLEAMSKECHKPNMITYSSLINGLCQEQRILEAVEILDRMKLQGLRPDAGLYGKIIDGFCTNCKFHEAANFLDEMVLSGIKPNRLTWSRHVRINNTVVQGLCSNGRLTRAFQLYIRMRNGGISVEPNTFKSLISHFCKKGDLHKSAHIIDEMVVDGCIPDEATWSVLVGGFWERRKMREAFESLSVNLLHEITENAEDSQTEDT